jgi:hypothetical protein
VSLPLHDLSAVDVSAEELEPARRTCQDPRFPPDAAPSLVCALVARLAAHGDRDAANVEPRIRSTWIRIARQAPHLAGNDIVLAEFLVTRTSGIGESTRSNP